MSLSAFPLMGFLQARLRGSRTICSEYETRKAQYAYRCVVLSDSDKGQKSPFSFGLNAPTGAWCSLTITNVVNYSAAAQSQCAYRCVVLPDASAASLSVALARVSMHLQVRGAP